MKKQVITTAGHYEWRWVQTHACGHQTQQATLGGPRPTDLRNQLAKTECPRCKLMTLLEGEE
jgi:hypothetical protein